MYIVFKEQNSVLVKIMLAILTNNSSNIVNLKCYAIFNICLSLLPWPFHCGQLKREHSAG